MSTPGEQLRYQLLHRTASAILLARQFHARHAVMLVHSFGDAAAGLDDYKAFTGALGAISDAGRITDIPGHSNPTLALGWVQDKKPSA